MRKLSSAKKETKDAYHSGLREKSRLCRNSSLKSGDIPDELALTKMAQIKLMRACRKIKSREADCRMTIDPVALDMKAKTFGELFGETNKGKRAFLRH